MIGDTLIICLRNGRASANVAFMGSDVFVDETNSGEQVFGEFRLGFRGFEHLLLKLVDTK